MSRRLKALGLTSLAALSLGALGASAAQATTPEFHCTAENSACFITSSGGEHGTGSNDNVFTFGTSEANKTQLKCTGNTEVEGAQFTALELKTSRMARFDVSYTGCKVIGIKAIVKMEGCKYNLNLMSASIPPTASMNIFCLEGKKITITPTGLACTITIGEQSGLNHVTFENKGGTEPTHIEANLTVEGITYTTKGAECPPGESGTHTNGKYTGHATLTGYESFFGIELEKVGLHVF